MANICFVYLEVVCPSVEDARKLNDALKQLKTAADKRQEGFRTGSDRCAFDAAFYDMDNAFHMAYWIKWGYNDAEVIALINFLKDIVPVRSVLIRYEECGSLMFGEYFYDSKTLVCRELPLRYYPDATDSDSDQERLQKAFKRHGESRIVSTAL